MSAELESLDRDILDFIAQQTGDPALQRQIPARACSFISRLMMPPSRRPPRCDRSVPGSTHLI